MISGIPATPASIFLTWSMPDVTDAEAPLTGYEIIFMDDRFLSLARIVPDTINVEVGLQTSHLQAGLSPNTVYTVGIAAVNLIGIGPFSSSVNFRIISGEGSRLIFTTTHTHTCIICIFKYMQFLVLLCL